MENPFRLMEEKHAMEYSKMVKVQKLGLWLCLIATSDDAEYVVDRITGYIDHDAVKTIDDLEIEYKREQREYAWVRKTMADIRDICKGKDPDEALKILKEKFYGRVQG